MNSYHLSGVAALMIATATGGYFYKNSPDTLTRIIDGDSLIINGSTHIRLAYIDAPELKQICLQTNPAFAGGMAWNCGAEAKRYLESFFKLKVTLKCVPQGTDIYKRTLAICYVSNKNGDKHDLGRSLVAAGMAVDWPQYSNGYYASEQAYASSHKIGIWSGTFDMPWDWRANRK